MRFSGWMSSPFKSWELKLVGRSCPESRAWWRQVISGIQKGSKLLLAIEFHVHSTVLHHQRIMLYIAR